jgi:diguanylate cyclase (GGDEF)-like protein
MKRLILAVAIFLGWALAAWAATPATLTTLHAVHALSHAEAAQGLPVAFEAIVTYRRGGETTLFVQDGSEALYVWAKEDFILAPGDRILVLGKTQDSFHPIVIADSVTVLSHGDLPKAVPATFDELIRSQRDCMLVTVRGLVHSADLPLNSDLHDSHLVLLVDGSAIDTYVNSINSSLLNGLLDSEVEVTGVATAVFDGKTQQTGVGIAVPSLAFIKVLKRASTNPWSLPVTSMDGIIANYRVRNLSQRAHVHGTVTYYQPGSALVLQSGDKSLWISTLFENPLRVGDQADVVGFPEAHHGFLTLTDADIQESPVYSPLAPQPLTRKDLASSKHVFDLVSIEAQVVMEVRENAQDEYVLVSEGQVFSAIYRHPLLAGWMTLPMKEIPLGSRVRVSGICILDSSNPFKGDVPFDLLMRTPDDIAVIAPPSLVNTRNLLLLLGALLIVVFAVLVRGWALERKVRRQSAVLSALTEAEAELERRRSSILEDINGARPLAEILEEIVAMVSSTLNGAPCWCEVADGTMQEDRQRELHGLRIVRAEIPARSGPALGTLFAGLDPRTPSAAREVEALQNGARLATLAIETRRLYSDLRRRSEFDLLTDIPNRFAMEKFMEMRIEEARNSGGNLGLIYIDLDKFKPINDTYGHHVGDLYLQAAALRMSRQLLGSDMLARLGGDEFAALVLLQHGKSDLDRIVERLESCFKDPFIVEGISLQGTASFGIAYYPENGATKDSLLSAADAKMYEVKNNKRQLE